MTSITKYQDQKNDLAILNSMAEIALKSGKYPGFDHATIMNVFLTARALGVDPILALNSGFNIINGKINMGAHFMVSLARRAGHSLKVVELTKEKCVMIGKRKDNDDSIKYEYTYEEAQEAGLAGKQNWKTNRKSMLYCACARHLFRMLFCDIAIPYDADEMNVDEKLQDADPCPIVSIPRTEAIQIEKIDPKPSNEVCGDLDMNPLDELKEHLAVDGIATERLEEWVKLRAQTKNETVENIIKACLGKDILPKFKKSFAKFIAPVEPEVLAV